MHLPSLMARDLKKHILDTVYIVILFEVVGPNMIVLDGTVDNQWGRSRLYRRFVWPTVWVINILLWYDIL